MVARCAMSGFVFQWPGLLALLLLAIPLAWLLAHARRQRLKLIAAMGGRLTTHRRLRDILRVLAFILLVLALARPGHSPQMESASRTGRDVVFALDVSRSMLAEDLSPSRLEVGKQAIRDALQTFGNERVGLVVYAGSASILCPLTYDYDFVRYMLEQAHPRSVDFGGTTLQSAVEKVIDQVFMDGRGGVQDLVVLTDGGDHGSNAAKVVELLQEKEVAVLMVGLGDPHRGSPIKVEDQDGKPQLLEADGVVVTTKLDDAALRAFAAETGQAEYFAAGVSPFHLGELYRDYAADKLVEASDSESGIIIYQEAAVWFLVPALILLLLAECWGACGLQLGQAALVLLLLGATGFEVSAADAPFRDSFDAAVKLMDDGAYEEAANQFTALYVDADSSFASAGDLAALQLNRGLSLIQLAAGSAEQSPGVALSYAQDAQLAFLSAKRYAPELQRAGMRLETTAKTIGELQAILEEQQAAENELNDAMQSLVEQLQALLEDQRKLRVQTLAVDIARKHPKRAKNSPPPPPIVEPADAATNSKRFVAEQGLLQGRSEPIKAAMQLIDKTMSGAVDADLPPMDTILTEPLKLMDSLIFAQSKAKELLAQWSSWPAAREEQQHAEHVIEEILELLGGDSQQEQSDESEEWDEYEEDYEYDYMDESEESMSSSEAMQGDFAAGGDMQELPVPNYSVEDILMEEQGSLQFRQQKRASANAGKVEKDY